MQSLAYKNDKENHEVGKNDGLIITRHGEIKVMPGDVVNIENGMIGLDHLINFCLINYPKKKFSSFKLLQSLDDVKKSFILQRFEKGIKTNQASPYGQDELRSIADNYVINYEDMDIYHVISIHEVMKNNVYKLSLNLRAPLIIDRSKRAGVQHVFSGDKYSIRHFIEYTPIISR